MILSLKWSRFKSLKDTNSWTIYYKAQASTSYALYAGTANHQIRCLIEGADKTDFEDNYKSGATGVGCEGDGFSYLVTF